MTEPSAVLSAVPRPAENRRPPDPAALMALYDANYQCLLALCPSLRNPALRTRRYRDDSLPGMPALELECHDQTRHTVTLGLTCRWDGGEGAELLPDVRLRLYRDSRQVELFGRPGALPIPGAGLPAAWLHRRHAGNRFLFHWLRYCLRRGYHLAENPGGTP